MELSPDIQSGLSLLSNLNDTLFQYAIKQIQSAITNTVDLTNNSNNNPNTEINNNLPSNIIGTPSAITYKHIYASLFSLLYECSRYDINIDELNSILEEFNLKSQQLSTINTVINTVKPIVRSKILSSLRSQYNILIGCDYRLNYLIQSNNDNSTGNKSISYLINLYTIKANNNNNNNSNNNPIETHQFNCSLQELQDLLSIVKDACRQAQKLAGATAQE